MCEELDYIVNTLRRFVEKHTTVNNPENPDVRDFPTVEEMLVYLEMNKAA